VVGDGYTAHHPLALLGLFSLIALLVDCRMTRAVGVVRQAAWYRKRDPTFSDALALVRKELWAHETFCGSPSATDTVKVPRAFMERLTDGFATLREWLKSSTISSLPHL
jgi:hypothetical protein